MEFMAGRIGSRGRVGIDTELRNAVEAIIATCYFKPGLTTMASLMSVLELKLIYSQEYQITDPEALWKLASNGAEVRYVPTGDRGGRLHAKVYYGIRQDGSRFAFVGSANLTHDGLFGNQEAGVLFDSRSRGDSAALNEILEWLMDLWQKHEGNTFDEFEYKRAKREHQHSMTKRPLSSGKIHPWKQNTKSKWGKDWGEIGYWVLKTRNGFGGVDNWDRFVEEKVIATGWDFDSSRDKMFRKQFGIGDIVLVCNGYPPKTEDDTLISIRGIARVLDDVYKDDGSKWWKGTGRRKAFIQTLDVKVRKKLIAKHLRRDSLLQATHKIDRPDCFEGLAIMLYEEYGVIIDV